MAVRRVLLLGHETPPPDCVACGLPIDGDEPTYPVPGGRVHEECAFGRFARYRTRDSGTPFDVDEVDA